MRMRSSLKILLNTLVFCRKIGRESLNYPYSRQALESVRTVNAFLEKQLPGVGTLEKVIDLVYAGAVTVCEMLGLEILDQPTMSRPTVTPPWKKRLEQKISDMRKKISVIYTYLGTTSTSKRVLRSVRKLVSKFKMKRRDPNFKDKISFKCENLLNG